MAARWWWIWPVSYTHLDVYKRQLTRQVAGAGFQVVVIDERSEIASSYQGVPQLDVGLQTDVLDGYTKELGVQHALCLLYTSRCV